MTNHISSEHPCDLLLTNGRLLDLSAAGSVIDDGALAIVGTDIVDVGTSGELLARWQPERHLDVGGNVISPGFVDAHVHLSAYLAAAMPYIRPTAPGTFSGGSNVAEIVPFVAEMTSMALPAELTATVLRPVFAAMLASGITSVVDAGSSGLAGLAVAADETGIRASLGPSLADMWHDESGAIGRRASHEELLDGARGWIEEHGGDANSRLRPLVSAVETIACSDELLAGIASLSAEYDIPTHIHSHITDASDRAHVDHYGRTATERLLDAGMLSPRCTAMHAGNASAEDIVAFASTGVTVNHNPLGNAMFGFGTVRQGAIPAMIAADIPMVLGSDYAGSMIASPFDSMRAALMVHREAAGADDGLALEDAIAMATNPGVPIGQPGRVGHLAPGQLADVVVIDTSGPHHLGEGHPVPSIALRSQPGDVQTVIVNGEIVVEDGQVTTLDVAAATTAAQALLANLSG